MFISVLIICAYCMGIGVFGAYTMEEKAHLLCRIDGYKVIEAKFGKETHFLCLQFKSVVSSPVANHRSALFLEPDADEGATNIQSISLSDITLAYGFPVEDPAMGSAEGYIGDDNQFYGVLHLNNRTLHADPYGMDDLDKFFGAFENDNMAVPRSRRDHAQVIR